MIRRSVLRLSFGGMLLGGSLSLTGCLRIPGQAATLTIATSWPEPERQALAGEFDRWLKESQTERTGPGAKPRIDWLVLDRGADPSRAVRPDRGRWDPRPRAPQVVLGGPVSGYRRMAELGQLAPADETPDRPLWSIVRRSPIGWAFRPESIPVKAGEPTTITAGSTRRNIPTPTFDDPRHDPIALAWALGELNSGTWAEGYARLVRDAGHPRRIGRQAGSALAAVERGEAAATPVAAIDVAGRGRPNSVEFLPASPPDALQWVEGAGIVAGQGQQQRHLARLFFQFLDETGKAERPRSDGTGGGETDPEVNSLVADLLGATLVDAQDELWTAWAALNHAEHPPRAAAIWLTQAPPWPPASIEKLERDEDGSGILVQTLVEQLVPDARLRGWLSRSWLGPKRLVDGPLLAEIARAADGRLVREPRFRAWLRAEWTAWARQRYRRVTRTVKGLKP